MNNQNEENFIENETPIEENNNQNEENLNYENTKNMEIENFKVIGCNEIEQNLNTDDNNNDNTNIPTEVSPRYYVFHSRLKAPSKSNYRFYSNENPYYAAGYGMPNCTAYMYGRYWEVVGEKPGIPLTYGKSATVIYWYCKNDSQSIYKSLCSQTPTIGAIACWSTLQNDNPNAPASTGHVAIIESMDSAGNITCSNSGWQSTNFYMKTFYKSSNYAYDEGGKHYYLQGFIHPKKLDFNYIPDEEGGSSSSKVTYQSHDSRYGWNPNVTAGTSEYAGNFGIAVDGVYVDKYKMRVHDKVKNQWLPWVQNRNDYAGNLGNPIDGLQIENATYRVHIKGGGWLSWVTGSSSYAGNLGQEIDAIQIK